ncbi:hypothetical protein BSLG_008199 [Batrachochytrium salamandrivorans]|nr:hypothetical protein BSLG_008199 [Batrachochytrium salamandrivorans]
MAKSIFLEDRFENLGATLVQNVATKTNEGLKNVAAGVNSMDLRKGIQAAVDLVVRFLKENARPITTSQEIAQVATISANGNKHIGQVIANVMEKVGKEGVITVQEGKTLVDELEITKDLLPLLKSLHKNGRPLLVIAEDVDEEALAACILNKLRGQLQVACVKAPGFGDNRKAILQDIAILTGGTVCSDEVNIKLDKCTIDDLGSVNLATVTKDDTIFLNGAGSKDAVAQRCEQLRSLISTTVSDYEREKLQELLQPSFRAELLSSKWVVAQRLKWVKRKIDLTMLLMPLVLLLRRALSLVVVLPLSRPAGFCRTSSQRTLIKDSESTLSARQFLFYRIIVDNAGEEGSVVVGRLLESYTPKEGLKDANEASLSYGYNAATSQYVDMIKEGIIDPLKVQRTALTDASSVAPLLTTTKAMIVDEPKK